ncbi:hypothetical protein DFH09DRAFT_1315321 [Mycena vulgaris]|nr:hypothetical protein DFH09DRAFT_1315321 [Mycena vulgaris]
MFHTLSFTGASSSVGLTIAILVCICTRTKTGALPQILGKGKVRLARGRGVLRSVDVGGRFGSFIVVFIGSRLSSFMFSLPSGFGSALLPRVFGSRFHLSFTLASKYGRLFHLSSFICYLFTHPRLPDGTTRLAPLRSFRPKYKGDIWSRFMLASGLGSLFHLSSAIFSFQTKLKYEYSIPELIFDVDVGGARAASGAFLPPIVFQN